MNTVDVYKRKSSLHEQPGSQYENGSPLPYDNRFVVKLIRNYRSHPEILRVPNDCFYNNELEPHAEKLTRESLCLWNRLPKKGFPIVFHGVIGKDERESRSPSFFNVDELTTVLDYVQDLLTEKKVKVQQPEIGIISPYRRQVDFFHFTCHIRFTCPIS